MKPGKPWLIIGGGMFILGLILFYLINPDGNKNLEVIKNVGSFCAFVNTVFALSNVVFSIAEL